MGHGPSSTKQAPRAHSTKNLGGTSHTSRTTGGHLATDHGYNSNPLNQSKRSVATTAGAGGNLENSMKLHGGYHQNPHMQTSNSVIDTGYQKQPRKAASQDRMNPANFQGHHNSGFSFHNTNNNLTQSVLSQQKRSNSAAYRGSSAHKSKQQSSSRKSKYNKICHFFEVVFLTAMIVVV